MRNCNNWRSPRVVMIIDFWHPDMSEVAGCARDAFHFLLFLTGLCPDLEVTRDARHTSHVTRHTSHVKRHTSNVTRHTSHVTSQTSNVTLYTSHVTRQTSHVTRHTSHICRRSASLPWVQTWPVCERTPSPPYSFLIWQAAHDIPRLRSRRDSSASPPLRLKRTPLSDTRR
jgi:hypothetical protein